MNQQKVIVAAMLEKLGLEMPKEIFEINGLEKIEPYIKKLAVDTAGQENPALRLVIGRNAHRVEHVLKLAAECRCPMQIHLLVHESIRDRVVSAFAANPDAKIVSERIVTDRNLPSFIVSDAGYYIQDGLSFDEAILSFKNERIKSFLKEIYEDVLGSVAA